MLISCKYCSGVHQRSFHCPNRPKTYGKKENNHITRFRNTSAWKKKRTEIKKRDLHLCQLCKQDGRYTFEGLDVHHIRPISDYWNGRLLDNNLITLCKYHHAMADRNEISSTVLYNLIDTVQLKHSSVSAETE